VIRLVTLDLYNTLCYATPSRHERLATVCRELGLECEPDLFVRPNVLAEDLYTVENGRSPLHLRQPDEQRSFYRGMWAAMLREAGLRHDEEVAERVARAMSERRGEWVAFDDAAPLLDELRRRGLRVGVISNTPVDATVLCDKLGLCGQLDFIVSSCLVGCEKPWPAIFEAALARGRSAPGQAVHVGDQPRSDALGAVGVGMHALLLDRHGLLEHEREYRRIGSLAEVPGWIDEFNLT
jgi:HAD superfamily hydrolase (TIGR01549 family)